MSKPLTGIKVLDLTTFVAAPVCARLLADLGADVIKVERPAGDGWREFGISYNVRFNDDENPVFDIYNTGKKCIALNLKDPKAKEIFWQLLEQSDVFVTNTRPDALDRLGFGREAVMARCPRLIYAIVLGFGEQGPEAARPAFDTTAFWTRSGFLQSMAPVTDDFMLISPPSGVGDTVTGYNLLAQINAALYAREWTGKGDYIGVSLFHTGIFTMGTMEIISQRPWGRKYPMSRRQVGPPGGCYRCADDQWIFLANGQLSVSLPKMFKMIGRPELWEDERFNNQAGRVAHKDELYDIFYEAYLTQPADEWIRRSIEVDLPMVKMVGFADVSEDEQAWANGYLEYMTCPNGETVVMPASPICMESIGRIETTPAPKIGTHTEEVLQQLGYSDEDIEAMEAKGTIARLK